MEYMPIASGEFGLIEKIRGQFTVPDGMTGIGDDCAVMPQEDGLDTLVSTDLLIEGVHFLYGDITPEDLGWKSAAVNISDIAAMGGNPTGTFLSIALPRKIEEEWVGRFIRGYKELSDRFDVPLLGGDTSRSPDIICINVTVLGSCPHGKAKRRSDAQAGDLICTTGVLGDSAAGLKMVLGDSRKEKGVPESHIDRYLRDRHYRPIPRVSEGLALRENIGVHAMMDISDGVASDLGHILKASLKGAVIDCSRIPLSEELRRYCRHNDLDPLDFALDGGEDYELLFTVSPDAEKHIDIRHYIIGEITECEGILWKGSGKPHSGFRHF